MKVINHTPRNPQYGYGKLKESLNAMLTAVHEETVEAVHHHDLIRIEGILHIGISIYCFKYLYDFSSLSISIASAKPPEAYRFGGIVIKTKKITTQEIVEQLEKCLEHLKFEEEDQDLMLAGRLLPDIIRQIKEYPTATPENNPGE